APHVVIVRAGEGRTRRRRGHRVEELSPPLPGQRADVSAHTLARGAATGGPADPPLHEPGSRETAVVLDGDVEFFIDGQQHLLTDGDSVTFDADLPHHFENNGETDARLIAIVAAALRRSYENRWRRISSRRSGRPTKSCATFSTSTSPPSTR